MSILRAASALFARYEWARQAGITYGGKRDMYEIFGYARELSTKDYRDRYARGGLAARIVDVYPNATWRGGLEIIEDENPDVSTPFEQAWDDIDTKHQLQAKLRRVDKLSSLSTYAVLLIGAPGELDQELPKGSPEQLLYFRPALGGGGPIFRATQTQALDASAVIASFDIDPKSPRFGMPQTYQIKLAENSTAYGQKPVHWSRIIHVADGCLEDDIYGVPVLESVWNLLDDLDKVTGGGAEAFWLRANQGLHVDIDKDMALTDAKESVEALKEQAELYQHQMTRWLRTRGVNVNTLGSDVANFAGPADAIITQIAGTKGIPKRILTGSEMGELASSQDRENWRDQVIGRQKSFAGPYIIRPLIDRLIKYGYLPTPKKEYEVRWPNISILTESERQQGAASWAGTATGEGQVFTNSEIRDKWYEMEPLSPAEQEAIKPVADKPGEAEEDPAKDPALKAAEQELMRVLASAIESGATEVVDAVLGTRHAGGPGSGNFGHAGRPGQVGGSADDGDNDAVRQPLSRLRSKLERSRSDSLFRGSKPFMGRMTVEPVAVDDLGNVSFSVRDFGTWVVPPDEEDDGDYDWKVPTQDTADALDKLAREFSTPDVKVTWSVEEKNWVTFTGERIRHAGGPGSGNFGHAGRPGEVGGSASGAGTGAGRDQLPRLRDRIKYDERSDRIKYGNRDRIKYDGRDRIKYGEREQEVERIPEDRKLYHSSSKASIPSFDAFFGGEEFINTFSPTEFGEHRSEAILPKGTRVLDLNRSSMLSNEFKAQIAKQEWPDDSEFMERLMDGDPTAEEDFYEVWTNKDNIVNALRERYGAQPNVVVKYQDEYLIPKNILMRIKVQRILGGQGSGNFGHAGRPGQVGGSAPGNGGGDDDAFHDPVDEVGGQGLHPLDLTGRRASDYHPSRPNGLDTRERFSDGKGNYTPERTELHKAIIAKFIDDTTPEESPTATILGGGMAAGKSTLVNSEGIGKWNTVMVNVDDIRDELPEYAKDPVTGKKPASTAFTHEEASDISKEMIKVAVGSRRNIVLDGTGNTTLSKLGGKIAVMRAGGHKIVAEYVTTSVEIAQARAEARGQKTGRFVPPTAMREAHRMVSEIFPEAVRQGLFDSARLYDTTGKLTLVASAQGRELTVHNDDLWKRFLQKAKS